jgi:hypothetical protein
LVTIIENRASISNLEFCIFSKQDQQFYVIGNCRSIAVELLDQFEFRRNTDNLDYWIDQFDPQLQPVLPSLLKGRRPHYYFLSSQWDTLPERESFAYLSTFATENEVTFLHHDSYLLDHDPESPAARRFRSYWTAATMSKRPIAFISEHTRTIFERHFGPYDRGTVAHYDFGFAYPRTTAGVAADAIELGLSASPYLLVFSIIDGRKSPTRLIENLVAAGFRQDYEIALIVRFANDDKLERIRLIDLALSNGLKVFYAPNDATYLWLVKHAHTVYYPSSREGFGMVPLDCKMFGKACALPEDADYRYLHDNSFTYESDSPITRISHVTDAVRNDLHAFGDSTFVRTIFQR